MAWSRRTAYNANRVHCHVLTLAQSLRKAGYTVRDEVVFDSITITVTEEQKTQIQQKAQERDQLSIWFESITIAFDETTSTNDILDICDTFGCTISEDINTTNAIEGSVFQRTSPYLTHTRYSIHIEAKQR